MDRALMTLDFGVEAESKPRIQVKEVRIRSQLLYWAVLGSIGQIFCDNRRQAALCYSYKNEL